MQTIEGHLSQIQKIFSQFFFCSFQICIKFQTFLKKDEPHSLCISEFTHHERRAEINV